MTRRLSKFRSLEIKANYTCNSFCPHCCAGNRTVKNSMSHDEIRENLEWFIETYGIEELCLSGGEPTVHPSFAENIRLSREKGLCLYLHTNGISFGKAHFASRHAPFISRVLVGLSCHNEASCGELTGIGKSFHARLDGIVNLQNQNVPLRTNCVVLRQNYKNLPDIGKLLLSLNVKKALFTLPFFFERCDEHVKAFVPPDLSEVTPYLQETLESLTGAGRSVFVQGLPPCRLGPFEPYAEIDPDRAFVDYNHQKENHGFLFSGMLGYQQNDGCRACQHGAVCWGFPPSGALGSTFPEFS